MDTSAASKEAVVLKLLAEGDTMLCLDARHPDACVPPHQTGNPALRLSPEPQVSASHRRVRGRHRCQPVVRWPQVRLLHPDGRTVGGIQPAHHGRHPVAGKRFSRGAGRPQGSDGRQTGRRDGRRGGGQTGPGSSAPNQRRVAVLHDTTQKGSPATREVAWAALSECLVPSRPNRTPSSDS